jgi:hypothetical protein
MLPSCVYDIVGTLGAKRGRFVTRRGIFRGDLWVNSLQVAPQWKRRPWPLLGAPGMSQ